MIEEIAKMTLKNQSESWDEFLSEINPKRTCPELLAMAHRLKKLYLDGDHLSQGMNIV